MTGAQPILPPACGACGTALPAAAAYCPGCGRAVKPLKGRETTVLGPRTDGPLPDEQPSEAQGNSQWAQNELPPRYRAMHLLGKGGMGVVFQCMDTTLERPVAIKLMSDRYRADNNAQRRFLREARAQAIVNHPNVATVLNVGLSPGGRPFIVMEYVEGRDLRQIIQEYPRGMDPVRACGLMEQACSGLAEAHAGGIVHRDLKPSNLMVQRDHLGQERIKILDLGLAKIVGGSTDLRTITVDTAGILVGTPAYMSPEQVAGSGVDTRADLYSLGVVLFELFTGRLPFESETLEGWLYQHLHSKPPVPSSVRSELEAYPELDSIVLWCLSKAPHERPRGAADLGVALERARSKAPQKKLYETEPLSVESVGVANESHASSSERMVPSALRRRVDLAQTQVETTPPQASPDPAALRRERYLALARAAEAAEERRRWDEAIEHWRQALKYAEDRESVTSQIEALQREINFEQVLAAASTHAAAGDWARAQTALVNAARMRPADPRVEQSRARMPRRLVEAWLEAARTRLSAFPEGLPRQGLMRRLAVARARTGNMQGAIQLLQEESRDPEVRILGLAQAALGAIHAGHREGLRPYLDRAMAAAGNLSEPGGRGRAFLELGRALTAYGDTAAATTAFQNTLASFLAAGAQYEAPPALSFGTDIGDLHWGKGGVSPTGRRSTRFIQANKDNARESAISVLAQAQAEAGLADEGLATAGMIDDPWTRAHTLAFQAQALARIGRAVEAERVGEQITFRLPRARAMRALAISRVYQGEMEGAVQLMREIASPDERAPVQGFLAAAWSRRGESSHAESYAREAFTTAMEVAGATARFETLLQSAEPLLNIGRTDLAGQMLGAASRLIDGTDDPGERVHGFLRLARIREKGRMASSLSFATSINASSVSPDLYEMLRRALGALKLVQSQADREECLEGMAFALGSAGANDLADELIAQSRNELERALIYVGLATGMS